MESTSPTSKRSPSGGASSPSSKKRRLSASPQDGAVRDGTLRIVAEMLRAENKTLQGEREALEKDKQTLQKRLEKSQESLRTLEDDVARVYKQKQTEADAQRRSFKQEKLQLLQQVQLLESQQRPGGQLKDNFMSKETTKEMDKFLKSCEQWQGRLTTLSGHLQTQAAKLETQEVGSIVRDLVTSVEMQTMHRELETKEQLLQWAKWMQEETETCLKDWTRSRQETEVFEAMERQLTNDRVVELETQLAQKRTIEREKEMELSSLRADQDELLRSTHAVPKGEWEALVKEKEAMAVELEKLKEERKQQDEQLERVTEDRESLKQQTQSLVEERHKLREQQETREFEVTELSVETEKEMTKLQEQLQTAKKRDAQLLALLKTAEKETEKHRRRKEELKILYAKFSSTMDDVAEKTMKIEELEQEMDELKSNLQAQNQQFKEALKEVEMKAEDAQAKKEQLELQVAQLHHDQSDLLAANSQLNEVKKQVAELSGREARQKKLTSSMQAEIARLKAQNEALQGRKLRREQQSVGQESVEREKQNIHGGDATKEALQLFIRRYQAAAEEKCSLLLQKVGELEEQKTSTQKQARKSCDLLRKCTQTNSCDDSLRASLLDVMATLEALP